MENDLHYKQGKWHFPPKWIERFCYCANLQTEHRFSGQGESREGDKYVYSCKECGIEKYIEGGELEARLKEEEKDE